MMGLGLAGGGSCVLSKDLHYTLAGGKPLGAMLRQLGSQAPSHVLPPNCMQPIRVPLCCLRWCQVDNEALMRALPLDPGESTTVGATFAAGVRSAHAGAETLVEELRLEYVGPTPAAQEQRQQQQQGGEESGEGGQEGQRAEAAAGAGSKAEARLGRRATLLVDVHVQPSVQVRLRCCLAAALRLPTIELPIESQAQQAKPAPPRLPQGFHSATQP